jgi:transcription-repair coupling factor (superfamily II helicase)
MHLPDLKGISIDRIPFVRELHNFNSLVFICKEVKTAEYVFSLLQKTCKMHVVILLEPFDSNVYEPIFTDYSVFVKRAAALAKLATPGKKVLVTTIEALSYKTVKQEYFQENLKIEVSHKISMKYVINELIRFGYKKVSVVHERGQFSVRGELIDVFATTIEDPVRINFSWENVDSIHIFDIESQISHSEMDVIEITRASEIILTDEVRHFFIEKYKSCDDRIIESMECEKFFSGIEWYLKCFHKETVSLLNYLDKDTKFIFDFEIEKYNTLFFKTIEKNYSELSNVLAIDEIFFNSIETVPRIFDVLRINQFNNNSIFQNHNYSYNIRKNEDLSKFIESIHKATILSFSSKGTLNAAIGLFKERKINQIDNFFDAQNGCINVIVSKLKDGFQSSSFDVYTEIEIFGEKLKITSKKNQKDVFKDRFNFSVNEYVVHKKHGVAMFDGLINLNISGVLHDFLCLRYKNDDKLYVPVEDISLIFKYGKNDANIQLDSLKGSAWITKKLGVHKKLLTIAVDLLQLAARRQLSNIESLELPENYSEFCHGFHHIETEDQEVAINDVLNDIRGTIPMDRLICGDVGFGKTEVALRAAFVVSSSSKQVVLLAPTTILVSQHYKVFKNRFEKFGIEICQISRFISQKELKENINNIANGSIKIIIATHAILSAKIKFFDLGLVIVDEEQHFGVKQKEFLHKLHEKTHFLTLSATPIPRTLQLAIAGIKDFSVIATAPMDRIPIKTVICDFNKSMIKTAIENEISIGGQVFFVTPRIEYLDYLHSIVTELNPQLRVAKACGKNDELEEIIKNFCNRKIDVLISTNIIDSGVDIPNANTILIHRFDLFGLSQLYQLRGRVGRSKRQAYAYLLLEEQNILTENAKKRLKVLQNLNKLGSGFSLANYDLDIRGGGNLFGEEQSGYIKEVGIELYQSMFQETILMLKAGNSNIEYTERYHEPQINLDIPVFIPSSYIKDSNLRLEIYRKIGALNDEGDVDVMSYELSNRFGEIPQEAKNLLTLITIRVNCVVLNIEKVDVGHSGLTFSFFGDRCNNIDGLLNFLKSDAVMKYGGIAKIREDKKIVIIKKWKNVEDRTADICELFRTLTQYCRI